MRTVLSRRRDGRGHTQDELRFLANAAADGSVPDYQLAAWLMAAYLNPLSEQETAELTLAMAESGERIDLTGLPKPWVDKHSTGGVGDKTTLVVLPILAACGLTVVKMSGRGLGITGGTVDKLLSVPGFRMDLSAEEMKEQAKLIGIAITGQSPDLAPADKTLYALRDATGTTESMPLIASSILSKKIAGGAEYLSLDVKSGSGAFMKDFAKSRELAEWLVRIGERSGLKVHAAITDMDQPLGSAVGNALEVAEALDVLRGAPLTPPVRRFRELCLELSGQTLRMSGRAESDEAGRSLAEDSLDTGQALEKARQWFEAQGGSLDASLPVAPFQKTIHSEADGFVGKVVAGEVGQAVVDLGGGRKTKEDRIDPSVGVQIHVSVGDRVSGGQPLFTIHASSEAKAADAEKALKAAILIADGPTEARPLILATVN